MCFTDNLPKLLMSNSLVRTVVGDPLFCMNCVCFRRVISGIRRFTVKGHEHHSLQWVVDIYIVHVLLTK